MNGPLRDLMASALSAPPRSAAPGAPKLLILPLFGWLLLSLRRAPIEWWSLHWPALPGLQAYAGPAHRSLGRTVKHYHVFTLIWIAWVMIALHVLGAVKHQFDGHPVLWRMRPSRVRPPAPAAKTR